MHRVPVGLSRGEIRACGRKVGVHGGDLVHERDSPGEHAERVDRVGHAHVIAVLGPEASRCAPAGATPSSPATPPRGNLDPIHHRQRLGHPCPPPIPMTGDHIKFSAPWQANAGAGELVCQWYT